ncbi:MAG TPA: sulfatase [Tepidisphaeraceae bacterium]|jgi:arylsulfatase A-like enzyme|nr:sulfatase [Tepidisphaeraceae bacterium]
MFHTSDSISVGRWFAVAVMMVAGSLAAPCRGALPTRPNIVLIIADDLGCEDSGPYGCKGVRTPNIDRLAREGMRFTQAFNTCSSCSPSRSCIITGRYPHNTGAERLHMPLPKEQITFVEKLKAAGYWTAQAGKWHLGPFVKDRFDTVNEAQKGPPRPSDDGSGCMKWVSVLRSRPKDKPFFFWLASIDPHRPYFEGTLAVPHKPQDVWVPPFLPDVAPTRKDLAMYYDEIGRLDIYIGKVLDELTRQGVLDQTLIIFITDNGRPFPRCKTSVYDSGIQSPFIVRWPVAVKGASLCPALISSVDLAPTILELAGLPPAPTFQGKSMATLLSHPEAPFRDHVFAEHNWHDYSAYERAVRSTRFKYIRNAWPDLPGTPPADAVTSITYQEMRKMRDLDELTPEQMTCFIKPRWSEELYDVEADPQELKNLIGDSKYAANLAELRKALDGWQRETADSVPEVRPPDKYDRETGAPLEKKDGQRKN